MGVQDLLPIIRNALGRKGGILNEKLLSEELGNRRIAIDTSVFLHKLMSTTDFAKAFHVLPSICLQTKINDYFDVLLKTLTLANLIPIFVFDGKKHFLKEGTNQKRSDIRDAAREEIRDLYATADSTKLDKIAKLLTKTVYVREDLIACLVDWADRNHVVCIGAPYEADWQIKQLELDGIVDGVITVDSDLILLGCKAVIYDWKTRTVDSIFDCNIMRVDDILDNMELTMEDFGHMCIFLGTDFIDRAPHRKGPATLPSWIKDHWSTWSDEKKDKYLDILDKKNAGYKQKFFQNVNIFTFAPVFKILPRDDSQSAWEAQALT